MHSAMLQSVMAAGKKLFCRAWSGRWGWSGWAAPRDFFCQCCGLTDSPLEVTGFTNTSGRLHQPFLVGRWCLSKTDCAPLKIWPFSIAALHDLESVRGHSEPAASSDPHGCLYSSYFSVSLPIATCWCCLAFSQCQRCNPVWF